MGKMFRIFTVALAFLSIAFAANAQTNLVPKHAPASSKPSGVKPAAQIKPTPRALAATPHVVRPHRVVIQVDQNDPAVMNLALNNAAILIDYYRA